MTGILCRLTRRMKRLHNLELKALSLLTGMRMQLQAIYSNQRHL